jgi:hypothetical protein
MRKQLVKRYAADRYLVEHDIDGSISIYKLGDGEVIEQPFSVRQQLAKREPELARNQESERARSLRERFLKKP